MKAEIINIYKIRLENLMGRDHTKDLGTDEG